MKKLNQFVAELLETVNSVHLNGGFNNTNEVIKNTVGDSLNNHRVPSVNQVIRYLTRENSSTRQYAVGAALRRIYGITRSALRGSRTNGRTDALDINEFARKIAYVTTSTGANRKVKSVL